MAMSFNSLPPTFRQGSRQNLTCSECHEIYRSPRLLPCRHSFCLHCVENLIRISPQAGVFPCPLCLKPTPVPTEGAHGFQLNLYIPEEDMEVERSQPQTMKPCPTHNPEPLILFCVPCDKPICLICKSTKHDYHETLDMSEAAARCSSQLEASKDRLGVTINQLSKVLAEMHDNMKAVNRKEQTLLQEVQARRDGIVDRVNAWCKTVTEDIKDSTASANTQLTQGTLSLQQKKDCLLQLQQRVSHALNAGSDVEKVHMEKEMRQGKGSEEELRKIKECIPITTMRPGVHFYHSLFTDDTIKFCQCLGSAVPLSLPLHTTSETILPVYQCGQDKQSRTVHVLAYINENNILIRFGDGAPYDKDKRVAFIDNKGLLKWQMLDTERKMYHYNRNDGQWHSSCIEKDCKELHSGNKYMLWKHHVDKHVKILHCEVKSFKPIDREKTPLFQVSCENPTAFSATVDGQLFAIVEEGSSERHPETQKNVHLFRLRQSQPFATYTPSDEHFLPADVCFWREDGQIKLLVADTNNDSIHVVRIEDSGCCFERYLAAGNGYLVHPTALCVDDQGNVWIGCSNGWVLKCEKLPGNEQAYDCDENSSEESVSGSALIVGNASQLTESTVSE